MSLNEETSDNVEDMSPIGSVASSLSPFERVLTVAEFTSHFKHIGKSICLSTMYY